MTFPLEHMPSVISIIMDNRDALSLTREAPVVFFDKRMSVLYLVSMVDPRVFLVRRCFLLCLKVLIFCLLGVGVYGSKVGKGNRRSRSSGAADKRIAEHAHI